MEETIWLKKAKKEDIPQELWALYQTWMEGILEAEYPGWYSKHVEIYFRYKGVRYNLNRIDFEFYLKNNHPTLKYYPHDSLIEWLYEKMIFLDLTQKLGIDEKQIMITGSLD